MNLFCDHRQLNSVSIDFNIKDADNVMSLRAFLSRVKKCVITKFRTIHIIVDVAFREYLLSA